MKTWFLVLALTWLAILMSASGCKPAASKTAPSPPPAKVANVAQEGLLNTIVLTAQAEERLGISLAAVEIKPVSRVRSYGGEVTLPPGASLVISAPVGGKLEAASPGGVPSVGMLVSSNQPIFRLIPLLSPERDVLTPAERVALAQAQSLIMRDRIDAAGQVAQAREQVAAAKIALDRAERLLRDSAGTVKAVDDARAQLNIATSGLEAAEARKRTVDNISLEGSAAGQQTPLSIESPQSGMIRSLQVSPGEVVSAGAPLFEVMKYDPVWVKVPVYAGETGQLAIDEPAETLPLNVNQYSRGQTARPIAAPPTATPLAATVDLYYELPNGDARLRPGERMTVRVKLQGASQQRVVPWSAIMHDIYGGAWLYENTAEHTFVRRRAQVRYTIDDQAVLESGPPVGAKVVTAGAVELFGTEFGFAK